MHLAHYKKANSYDGFRWQLAFCSVSVYIYIYSQSQIATPCFLTKMLRFFLVTRKLSKLEGSNFPHLLYETPYSSPCSHKVTSD